MGQHPSSPLLQQRPHLPRTPSLRQHRKKSLELPEFAALSRPIPMAASVIQQPPSPPHTRSHYFPPAPIHKPIPQPLTPSKPLPKPTLPTVQEDIIVVRSRLPLGFTPREDLDAQSTSESDPEGTQEATITWRGQGKDVYLTNVLEPSQRVKMVHEPGSKTTFFTTVRLPPGNHPLRFLVDDQPRCTDTLPTATDTDGTLVNYIEIPSPFTSPQRSRTNTAASGSLAAALSSTAPGAGKSFPEMEWTGEIPPRLHKLAAEEEAYLSARSSSTSTAPSLSSSSGPRTHPQRYTQLPPPPPVPYPPTLPRHLEKVILNSSSASRNPHSSQPPSSRPRIMMPPVGKGMLHGTAPVIEGGGDDSSVLPVPNHVVLNHLGTSAIKNGVLAVGTTTRYHRKYISTIYYKPVSSYSS